MAHQTWTEDIKQNGKVVGYRVRYTDQAGVRHQEPGIFQRKQDAIALRDAVQKRIFRERTGVIDPDLKTADLVQKFLLECRAGTANVKGERLAESTIKTYRMSLNYLIEAQPVFSLCDEDFFIQLKSTLYAQGLAEWTVAGKLKDMRTFMEWCRRRKYILINPFQDIGIAQPDALPRYFSDDEIALMDHAAMGDPFNLAYWLGLKCGLRRGEVIRADKRDIRWLTDGTGELLVWADESKNRHYRTVPLPVCVMALVGSRGQGRLYPGLTDSAFEHMWSRFKAKAGIIERPSWRHKRFKWAQRVQTDAKEDQARFHDLRHTFCRIFLESGAGDIHILAQITGHKSLDVLTRIYGHFRTQRLHEAVATMENRPKFMGLPWANSPEIIAIKSNAEVLSGTLDGHQTNAKSLDK